MKTLYTAEATTTGGRDGTVNSSDNVLSLKLATPKQLGGPGGAMTNPEQLFAAGYSACFDSALRHIARMKKIAVNESFVTAQVSIGAIEGGAFGLAVTLKIKLPGLDHSTAQDLVNAAHKVCPYSNATRNNIQVDLVLEE
jgi:Ohr subfamily peroxiredoxin